jgi:hypothetical protein
MDENIQTNYEYLNPRKIPSTGGKWKKKSGEKTNLHG